MAISHVMAHFSTRSEEVNENICCFTSVPMHSTITALHDKLDSFGVKLFTFIYLFIYSFQKQQKDPKGTDTAVEYEH